MFLSDPFSDQVFGCSLASLCQRESSTVPHFVKLCIDHVESKGEFFSLTPSWGFSCCKKGLLLSLEITQKG